MSKEKFKRAEREEMSETENEELEELKRQYKDIVEFEPQAVQTQTRNLRELKGKYIIIHGFELRTHPRGEIAIITIEHRENGGMKIEKFHTFSRVVIDQLKAYQPYFEQGKKLLAKVGVRKGKSGYYLSLDKP